MIGLIKHLIAEAKKYIWEELKKLAPKKLERFQFDARVIQAIVDNCRENVAISVRTKEGDNYFFQKVIPAKTQVNRAIQKDPYF
jgi:hypothetical protein